MEIRYSDVACSDLAYWKKRGTPQIRQKITSLLESIEVTPFAGIGKPEKLKEDYAGKWSRRIDSKNRLIYGVFNEYIEIYSLKGHYKDT
jgi:toxin YoeB